MVGCVGNSSWTAAERDIIGNPIPGTAVISHASFSATAVASEAAPCAAADADAGDASQSAIADTGEATTDSAADAGKAALDATAVAGEATTDSAADTGKAAPAIGSATEPANGTSAPAPSILRVLTVDNPADSAILRTPGKDLTPEMLSSPEYAELAKLMVATVTDPSEDGVGIAAPQIGISRRIVAVQRFDKAGEPFEVYPNIRIIATRGDLCSGPEGCLSVPGRRGNVLRYRDIDIQYTLVPPAGTSTAATDDISTNGSHADGTHIASASPAGSAAGSSPSASGSPANGSHTAGTPTPEPSPATGTRPALRDTIERIQGFTAVIFQHECDHLDGILYIDKLEFSL